MKEHMGVRSFDVKEIHSCLWSKYSGGHKEPLLCDLLRVYECKKKKRNVWQQGQAK
jgi:hypothetical protein